MRVVDRNTGEEMPYVEIYLNKGDLERLLPWLQERLGGMIALNDEEGETIVGFDKRSLSRFANPS